MNNNAGDSTVEQRLEDELNGKSTTENQDSKQSDTTSKDSNGAGQSDVPVEKKYKLPDGRELSGDQVTEEYRKLQVDYTKKSQELASKKDNSLDDDPLKDFSPDEKEIANGLSKILPRLGYVKKDEVGKEIDAKKSEIIGEAGNFAEVKIKLKSDLDTLEKEFDGETVDSVVKPKVDRNKILNFIKENGTTNLTLSQIARVIDPEAFAKYDVAKLQSTSGSGNNLPRTEGAGAGVVTPPGVRYSFQDGSAERAVKEILGVK